MFFEQIFQQSQNVTRKTMFVQKIRTYNVDEIDTYSEFHQHFTSNFCANFLLLKKLQTQTVSI